MSTSGHGQGTAMPGFTSRRTTSSACRSFTRACTGTFEGRQGNESGHLFDELVRTGGWLCIPLIVTMSMSYGLRLPGTVKLSRGLLVMSSSIINSQNPCIDA